MAESSSARRKTAKKKASAKAAGKKAPAKRAAASPKSTKKSAPKPAAKKTAAIKAKSTTAKQPKLVTSTKSPLLTVIENALADMKAVNVMVFDVRGMTDVADHMVIASGNSDRHVRSIAENVIQQAKKSGFRPMGAEGEREGEWALVDLQDVIVHVMLPRVRDFYRLENLWDVSAARREAAQG